MTTYTITYDRDDDGTFSADITPDVLEVRWRLGMDAPFASVAPVATATITVRNDDQHYSPDAPNADIERGLTLRIRSDDGTTTRTHFVGSVMHVTPQTGTHGERQALITAECPQRALHENRVRLDAMLNVRADQVVNALLDRVPMRLRYLAGVFMVGVSDRAELGVSTRLPAATAFVPRNLQTGISTFAYVGDTWDDGIRAINALRPVVEAERARFFLCWQNKLVKALF